MKMYRHKNERISRTTGTAGKIGATMDKNTTRNRLSTAILGIVIALLIGLAAPGRALAASGPRYSVKVDSGYLALRTYPSYEEWNEIGELYTGDTVTVLDRSNGQYWWVYSPKLNREGYVNKDYLVKRGGSYRYSYAPEGDVCKVRVNKGYLALRTYPSYEEWNEIGELYTGDTVTVLDRSNGQYWWVYSPKLGLEGYVNSDYLTSTSSRSSRNYRSQYGTRTVRVKKGYLALRTYPSYEDWNEIGQLYTGDTVNVLDKSNGQYWWVYSPKLDLEGYVNKDYLVK